MPGQPRAVVDDAEQDRCRPLAACREHLPGAMVAVPVPQAVDVLGLVAADLAIGDAALGSLGTLGTARRQPAPLVEAFGAHEAAQRGIGRNGPQLRPALGECNDVVVVELHAPALVS